MEKKKRHYLTVETTKEQHEWAQSLREQGYNVSVFVRRALDQYIASQSKQSKKR